MEPLAFLRYLLTLGQIVHLTTVTDALPDAEDMDPESCYLGQEIDFRSDATKEQIERVFDFVRDDCTLTILPPHTNVQDYIELLEHLPDARVGRGRGRGFPGGLPGGAGGRRRDSK